MMEPWFIDRFPERLDDELQALQEAGYGFELDAAARQAGRIVIVVKYPSADKVHDLICTFPDNYPYFPFDITSHSFPGGRHKNPFCGSLCLLKDPHSSWRSHDTLAGILDTQVAKILVAHAKPEEAASLEAHEATQVSGQLGYLENSIVFTGDWNIPEGTSHGYLSLGMESDSNPNHAFRGAVLEVQDETGKLLLRLDKELLQIYSKQLRGRWVRLSGPPPSIDSNTLMQAAIDIWPLLAKPEFKGGTDVTGILFPEELTYGTSHENWIFLVREKIRLNRGESKVKIHPARSDQASKASLQARSPKLSSFPEKKILICGLGSIGSVFAWQMARAGIGTLNLIDQDFVQIGNTPRWMYGWDAVGRRKACVMAERLRSDYPYIKTKAWVHHIGGVRHNLEAKSDLDVFSEAVEGVDLIFDATAEWCVSQFLSDMARERQIPYVWATGTPGGWGGVIGRIAIGKTKGCWKCYQRKLGDGTIKVPNQESSPDIQPVGCFHPTFTGTGFDMDHVTLGAVRLATSTLLLGSDSPYPDFGWDVGVVDLWSSDGVPIAPHWQPYALDRHVDCDCDG